MQKTLRTSILPSKQQFAKIKKLHELDFKALCVFVATGFFMDDDTFYKDEKCLLPAHDYTFDSEGFIVSKTPNFQWHYSPRDLSFEQALRDYEDLLVGIIEEQTKDSEVILPLSGGLDSRSQAKVFKDLGTKVQAYSYEFEGGYPETKIARRIAKVCGFDFRAFTISRGYLWDSIEDLAGITGCYSEFTHPRQMGVFNELKSFEGIFSLGHWGDVFFDRGAPEGVSESTLIPFLLKKMLRPGGFELASELWTSWNLDGTFNDYLISRIETALSKIAITDVSAKARAFKTTQWAHRWTTTNLSIFGAINPISLPYYDDRMCKFICTIPEVYLADRKLQIAHLRKDKQLSKITWHAQKPFNVNTYPYNKVPYNLPYKIVNKLIRNYRMLTGNPYVQRNFELQFMGDSNSSFLESYLFSKELISIVPKEVVTSIYDKFRTIDCVNYSHPLSMLLTLALWNKRNIT